MICTLSSCLHVACNLVAIDLQLDLQMACNDLQQKFQHAEYFITDLLIIQPIPILFSYSFRHLS